MFITTEEVVVNCKSLATWLERLPPEMALMDPEAPDICLLPHPHITAQALRLWLPSEGRA